MGFRYIFLQIALDLRTEAKDQVNIIDDSVSPFTCVQ